MAEGGEVTAGYDDGLYAEPFAADALLELEREEPVVAASHDMDRNWWPGVKRADVVESLVQLRCGVRQDPGMGARRPEPLRFLRDGAHGHGKLRSPRVSDTGQ